MEDRAVEWIYAEPVAYLENHDPSDIYLKDGRDLRVGFVYFLPNQNNLLETNAFRLSKGNQGNWRFDQTA